MPRSRFFKTLFVPSLYGQKKLWLKDIVDVANRVDEIISLGNFIGLSDFARDNKNNSSVGNNVSMTELTFLRSSTEESWTQLVGPHEILALNFPDEFTGMTATHILRNWWLKESSLRKFEVATVNKERLVSHGGLTYGLWRDLGRPDNARDAAKLLNMYFSSTLYQGPCQALGNGPNFSANPIFADALSELYPSWLTSGEEMPFTQIHGSRGLNTYDGREMVSNGNLFSNGEDISYTSYGSVITFENGARFINVNPEVPQEREIDRLERPWKYYVESTPIIDVRDDVFEKVPEVDNNFENVFNVDFDVICR